VEGIYKHIDDIAVKNKNLAQKLIDGHDACMMAFKLATIVTDVPFAFEHNDSEVKKLEIEDFKRALEKEEFHTLPKRVDDIFDYDGKFNSDGKGQMKLI
jgi:5'-3' exonuclease